jgi:hypothetical protein
MREGDSREEDKEEGRGLGKGSFFGKHWEKEEGERRRLEGKISLGIFTRALVLLGFWAQGPGNLISWS